MNLSVKKKTLVCRNFLVTSFYFNFYHTVTSPIADGKIPGQKHLEKGEVYFRDTKHAGGEAWSLEHLDPPPMVATTCYTLVHIWADQKAESTCQN